MKKLILIILLALSVNAEAKFTGTFDICYLTREGWSKYYTVDVTFMTGYELNTATRTYDYDIYKTYATVFWGQGQATIIKVSTYVTACGYDAQWSCIQYFNHLNGTDQNGTDWYVCLADYCY